MAKIIDFSEEARQKHAENQEKELFTWLEQTAICRLGVFMIPANSLVSHPAFMQHYLTALREQLQDMVETLALDKMHGAADNNEILLFGFAHHGISQKEEQRIRGLIDLSLKSSRGGFRFDPEKDGWSEFPPPTPSFKELLQILFLSFVVKIKSFFNFKRK